MSSVIPQHAGLPYRRLGKMTPLDDAANWARRRYCFISPRPANMQAPELHRGCSLAGAGDAGAKTLA